MTTPTALSPLTAGPRYPMSILYFAIMSIGMGQTVVFGVIPYIGLALGLDKLVIEIPWLGFYYTPAELVITALTSVASLAFVLTASYWGRRSDRVGRKPIILTGLIGYSIGTVIFSLVIEAGFSGLVSGWWLYGLLILTRVALVALMAASMPAASAFVVDVSDNIGRVSGIGRLSASSQLGTMVGPALVFFTFLSWTAPLYIQAVLTAFAALLVWQFLPESRTAGKHSEVLTAMPAQARLRFWDNRYRVYLCIGLAMYTMMGVVQQTLGFYFHDLLGLNKVEASQQFSFALMMASVAGIVALLLVVQRWKRHPIHLLQLGLPFTLMGYLCLALAEQLWMLQLGMVLFGFGMGMAAPGCSVTATYQVGLREQGSLAGLNASVAGMGFVIGPLIGGAIYASSPSLTYWFSAMCIVPIILLSLTLKPVAIQRDSES